MADIDSAQTPWQPGAASDRNRRRRQQRTNVDHAAKVAVNTEMTNVTRWSVLRPSQAVACPVERSVSSGCHAWPLSHYSGTDSFLPGAPMLGCRRCAAHSRKHDKYEHNQAMASCLLVCAGGSRALYAGYTQMNHILHAEMCPHGHSQAHGVPYFT